jgi:hypothetical protein
MPQFRVQPGPPRPECFYIRVMLSGRNNAPIPGEMIQAVVRSTGRIRPHSLGFIVPTATKLRTTIATPQIASVIKINFNITRDNIIFGSCAVLYLIKIHCGPGFS